MHSSAHPHKQNTQKCVCIHIHMHTLADKCTHSRTNAHTHIHTHTTAGTCDEEGLMEGIDLGTPSALTKHFEAAHIDAQVCLRMCVCLPPRMRHVLP